MATKTFAETVMTATLRVRNDPFFLTNRGVAVICDITDGDLPFGRPAVATIRNDDGSLLVEPVRAVEAALDRSEGTSREWPGLVFACERGDERAERLGRLLRVGSVLTLSGRAAE